MKDKTPKKPKSKNPLLGGPSTSAHPVIISKRLARASVKKEALGTHNSPLVVQPGSGSEGEDNKAQAQLEAAEEEQAGQKRKRYITVVEGGKKRKVVDVVSPLVCIMRGTDVPPALVPPRPAGCH